MSIDLNQPIKEIYEVISTTNVKPMTMLFASAHPDQESYCHRYDNIPARLLTKLQSQLSHQE